MSWMYAMGSKAVSVATSAAWYVGLESLGQVSSVMGKKFCDDVDSRIRGIKAQTLQSERLLEQHLQELENTQLLSNYSYYGQKAIRYSWLGAQVGIGLDQVRSYFGIDSGYLGLPHVLRYLGEHSGGIKKCVLVGYLVTMAWGGLASQMAQSDYEKALQRHRAAQGHSMV